MKEQMVQDWMTRDPIAVTGNTTLPEACRLMSENSIRRLPVVDNGRLIGIVTWGDLREASASDASTLSVTELYYLLDRLPISSIMTRNPITVKPLTTISRAAQLMLEYKIGGLPVTSSGKLVGIITESDIFRLLAVDETKRERIAG